MAKIILIETATAQCSAAIAEDGKLIASRESSEPRAHASLTALFVKEMLDELGLKVSDCDAVCVSAGPGSYTGLRVGSSSAKGLCFGGGLPLIALRTPDILVQMAFERGLITDECKFIVPMIDARRMEVYCAPYRVQDGKAMIQGDIRPLVVEEGAFGELLKEGKVLFIGDGADKCKEIITSDNALFCQTCPHASGMAKPAFEAFQEKKFEDTAYFEPFYLKEYVATVSRKKLF